MPSKYKNHDYIIDTSSEKKKCTWTQWKSFLYIKKLRSEMSLMTSTLPHTTRFLKLH